MKINRLTHLEIKLLSSIEKGWNQYMGGKPVSDRSIYKCWISEWSGISGKNFSGVYSSLIKKGIIINDNFYENVCAFSDKAIELMKGINYENKYIRNN